MKYRYSETAGYYGNGGWVVYSYDCFGLQSVWKVFSTEQEAKDYCRPFGMEA